MWDAQKPMGNRRLPSSIDGESFVGSQIMLWLSLVIPSRGMGKIIVSRFSGVWETPHFLFIVQTNI
jgi:hypothetical protein